MLKNINRGQILIIKQKLFINEKTNGQVSINYPEGENYNGDLDAGKRNGYGTLTYSDGRKFVVELKNDEPWDGKGYIKIDFGDYVGSLQVSLY